MIKKYFYIFGLYNFDRKRAAVGQYQDICFKYANFKNPNQTSKCRYQVDWLDIAGVLLRNLSYKCKSKSQSIQMGFEKKNLECEERGNTQEEEE